MEVNIKLEVFKINKSTKRQESRTKEEQGEVDDSEDSGGTIEEQGGEDKKKISGNTGKKQGEQSDTIDIADKEQDSENLEKEEEEQSDTADSLLSGIESKDTISERQVEEEGLKRNDETIHYYRYLYNLGHVFKNMALTTWYSYMLLFLTAAVKMNHTISGMLIMIGLFVNGLCIFFLKYIKLSAVNKFDYGTVYVMFFGLGMYSNGIAFHTGGPTLFLFIYFTMFITVFQGGCAFIQFTDMMEAPRIKENVQFKFHRFIFEDVSKVLAYILTIVGFFITNLYFKSTEPDRTFTYTITYPVFMGLIWLAGTAASCSFLKKRYRYTDEDRIAVGLQLPRANKRMVQRVYEEPIANVLTAFMYVAVKVYLILNLIYLSLWISEREFAARGEQPKEDTPLHPILTFAVPNNSTAQLDELITFTWYDLAYVPLSIWSSSIVGVVLYWALEDRIASLKLYMLTFMLASLNAIYILLHQSDQTNIHLYLIASVIGLSGSLSKLSSGNMIYHIIDSPVFEGGPAHQIMLCGDKFTAAIIVFLISMLRCPNDEKCAKYYHFVVFNISVFIPLVGLLCAILLFFIHRAQERHFNRTVAV